MSETGYFPEVIGAGRAWVYVLPCRERDILKVGFSRDPLQRLHALHRRFFEFFDLERALLVEADTVREARFIERALIRHVAAMRAPAPLAVREVAAGGTEWFAGVAPEVVSMARMLAAERGHVLHAPLAAWLRRRLATAHDVLYGWSARLLDAVAYEHFNLPASGVPDRRAAEALRETLDLLAALDMELQDFLPQAVLDWYRYGCLPGRD